MLKPTLTLCLFAAITDLGNAEAAESQKPNIMFISVDDMSCDSIGVFGCELEGTTPHIDKLASQGMRFEYAHVQVGNCMPCRNVLFSGRYPHNNQVEGFYQVKQPGYPVLCELMQAGGYFTAIRGKVSHSTPYHPFPWDLVLDTFDGRKQHPKNIESYYQSTRHGIAEAVKADKPFCLLVNVSDPHKPFYGMSGQQQVVSDPNVPSRIYQPAEVPIPGFLFDHPDIRLELAHYYSSVRRADDCVGAALKALQESGKADSTVVVFLSDHGMPLPFAKTALYHHSTRTPWIVRWPGVTSAGRHDRQHMISGVDLLPTLLDIAQLRHPEGLDGRSFLPLLKGESQTDREMVYKEYNENSGGARNPMRGTQTKKFGYLFNPWSDGKRTFKTATTGTLAFRTMKKLAAADEQIAERLRIFEYAEREQFFDYEKDPNALHNLIDDPAYADEIAQHRAALEAWMVQTGDHALEAFRNRHDETAVQTYMAKVEAESAARRAGRRKNQSPQKRIKAIRFKAPTVIEGESVMVSIIHSLPARLGSQKLHVTLKDENEKRLERQVISVKEEGTAELTFSLKGKSPGASVSLAAFIGEDFQHNLQHISTGPLPVRK